MRGTLEQPPIVVRQTRLKLVLTTVFGVAATLAFGWSLSTDLVNESWVYVIMVINTILFALGTFMSVLAIIRPGTLTLDETGVTWRQFARTTHFDWKDFAYFRLWSPRPFADVNQAAFVYADDCPKHRLGRKLTRNVGSFGVCWELSPSELVFLLDAAHTHWSRPKTL